MCTYIRISLCVKRERERKRVRREKRELNCNPSTIISLLQHLRRKSLQRRFCMPRQKRRDERERAIRASRAESARFNAARTLTGRATATLCVGARDRSLPERATKRLAAAENNSRQFAEFALICNTREKEKEQRASFATSSGIPSCPLGNGTSATHLHKKYIVF